MKLLIVEDEKELIQTVSAYLKREGYICEKAHDYFTAEDKISSHEYDVVVLDITLPDGNGLDLMKSIKQHQPGTGVLIVSAKNSLDDKLAGLDLGADDYITKPFHLAELNSRINAILRRRKFNGSARLTFNEIEIDFAGKKVSVQGKTVELTKKEFELLFYFISNKDRVLTREGIAAHLWGDHTDMADNFDFIYTHIKNLRKKIEAKGGKNYLRTIYGVGYKYTDQ